MKTKYLDQSGLAGVLEVIVVALAILVVGGVGYSAYKARVVKTTEPQTLRGNITKNDCSKANSGCFDHTLNTDAGKTYGLVGSVDIKPHLGKPVTVKGTISPNQPPEVISVITVEPDPSATPEGTLNISVTCMHTIDPEPCPTSIKIENQSSTQGKMTPYTPTDANGKLSVKLAPGSYFLTSEPKAEYPYVAYPQSNPVEVNANQTKSITILYHDGTK